MAENNEDYKDFRTVPKRKLSEAEKQIIMLKIEKVRLQREKTSIILNKSIMLFFAFLSIAVVGLLNKLITAFQLNLLVTFGVAALIIGILPYTFASKKEENELEKTIDELTN